MVYIPSSRLRRESLGEVLPPLPGVTPNVASVAQYDSLASGKTVGGNFQHFQDAASLGWVPNTKEGYALYLAWNSAGLGTVAKALPEYVGWSIAASGAYAVINGEKPTSIAAPWTVETYTARALQMLKEISTVNGWDAATRQVAADSFARNFPRLLAKWGYKGPAPTVTAPTLVENPYFKSLGQTVYVDKALIAYDGPDRDPAVAARGGREFALTTGQKWRWGAAAAPVTLVPYLELMLTPGPQSGPPYAVIAYRINLKNPDTRATVEWGTWVKWNGWVKSTSSSLVSSVFLEDARRSNAASFNLAQLDKALAGSVGAAPPANLGDTFGPPPGSSASPAPLSSSALAPSTTPTTAPKPPAGPSANLWSDATAYPSDLYTPAPATLTSSSGGAVAVEDGAAAAQAAPSGSSGGKGGWMWAGLGVVALVALGGRRRGAR